jgi:hypothetical protein
VTERHVMLVFTRPHPEADDRFDRWYTEEHLDDVLRVPGIVAAQRFRLAASDQPHPAPAPYLAIYEVEGDLEATMGALVATRPERRIDESFDAGGTVVHLFTATTERRTAP